MIFGKFALLIFVQTKKGWLVWLGQERFAWGWGNCLKFLKRGVKIKREERTQRFLKKGASWVKVWVSLNRGTGTPLQTMNSIKSFLQINKNTTTNISFIYVFPNNFSKTYLGLKSWIMLSKTKLQWINKITFGKKM